MSSDADAEDDVLKLLESAPKNRASWWSIALAALMTAELTDQRGCGFEVE